MNELNEEEKLFYKIIVMHLRLVLGILHTVRNIEYMMLEEREIKLYLEAALPRGVLRIMM